MSGLSDAEREAVNSAATVNGFYPNDLFVIVARIKADAYAEGHAAGAAAVRESVRPLVSDWQANGNSRELGDPTAHTWHEAARQLLDALDGLKADEVRRG